MLYPRPRSVPVLAFALCLIAPAIVLAASQARWQFLESSVCDLGQEIMALGGCGQKKVERAADRVCAAASLASDCARVKEGKGFFKAIAKAVKRCRKLAKTAEKKGIDTSGVPSALENTRIATRSLILCCIDEVKDRPGFIDNDRLLKAVAKAEVQIERAKLALTGKKPHVRAFAAYRLAFNALRKVK